MRYPLSLFAFVCLIGIQTTATEPLARTNIVFILADDLGINDLHCYGRRDHHTPHLDRLASQGMRFTSAYCAQPICSPSRAAILTGKAPARLHLTALSLNKGVHRSYFWVTFMTMRTWTFLFLLAALNPAFSRRIISSGVQTSTIF